jgi:hypothetical protein
MNNILTYVTDPGWWFTAFFIAILTSVVAGFLKDAIERRISSLSARYRTWRADKASHREDLITRLANDPTFLTIGYVRASLLVALYFFMAIMFMLLPLLSEILQNTCTVVATSADCKARNGVLYDLLIPVLGITASLSGYKATSVYSIVSTALKRYRESKGHPRLG